jgi:hypothetical protein
VSGVLRVLVDDSCDKAAIRAALACAEDRHPKIVRDCLNHTTEIVEANWTRLDSPKRETQVRISAFDVSRTHGMGGVAMQPMLVRILRQALVDDATDEDLHRWHADLQNLALVAAMAHSEGREPSGADLCAAYAPNPWSGSFVERAAPTAPPGTTRRNRDVPSNPDGTIPERRSPNGVRTMDAEGFARHLPDMPDVAIIRKADFNGAGRARVHLSGLFGTARHMSAGTMEIVRAHARFRHVAAADRDDATRCAASRQPTADHDDLTTGPRP